MKSRWLINLGLLLAIGIMTLIARYEPGIEKEPAAAKLTPVTTDEITRIEVTRKTHDPLLLQLDGADWRVGSNPSLPAEPSQVMSLARLADQTAERSYAAADLDLKKLELDPPRSRVTLNDLTLDFGALDALDGLRYVRVGPHVYLIPDLYQHLIDADASQFVRRRLLNPGAHIRRLELPGLTLSEDEGIWSTTPEADAAIDADRLVQFVEHWENAQALSLRRDATNDDFGSVSILLRGQDQPLKLIIRSRDPELVLARPDWGVQYVMAEPAERFLALEKPPAPMPAVTAPDESAPPPAPAAE